MTSKKYKRNTKSSKLKIIKGKRKTQKMSRLQCSPTTKKKSYTCYTDEALHKLRDMWNSKYPNKSIETNDSKEIWEALNNNLKTTCKKESCWLKQHFVNYDSKKKIIDDSFAPKSPDSWKKKPNEWLTSSDIEKVMKQYEKAYKCFSFLGPSPIDFDTKKIYGECVWEKLCHFNLKEQLARGKTKFGVVFNLDPHYLDGSHWVSLFINVKKKMIFYFDSVGTKIPPRIMRFVNTVKSQGQSMGIDFTFDQNYPVEHQYGDTECGIYSIFFIVHMLEDKINGEYLKTHILRDKYMEKFRKVYFNSNL